MGNLIKPPNAKIVDPSTGRMREEWSLYFDQLTKTQNTDAVFGPAASTDGNLPSFDGTDGKTLQDSGIAAANVVTAAAALTDTALVFGDGGVKGVKTLPATYNGDLNSLAGTVANNNLRRVATGATNVPSGATLNGSHVHTYVWDTNAARQVFLEHNSYEIWSRAKNGGVWSSWVRVLDTSGAVVSTSPSAGVGYATGAGAAVTQITSRATGVTVNAACGTITMFSAAGSAAVASFVVTNSAVAATDTIILNQRGGTNVYHFLPILSAAGSFVIGFYTTGGTAVDAPIINFSIVKAVAA